MTNKLSVIFSTLAGICFVGGLAMLTKYGGDNYGTIGTNLIDIGSYVE